MALRAKEWLMMVSIRKVQHKVYRSYWPHSYRAALKKKDIPVEKRLITSTSSRLTSPHFQLQNITSDVIILHSSTTEKAISFWEEHENKNKHEAMKKSRGGFLPPRDAGGEQQTLFKPRKQKLGLALTFQQQLFSRSLAPRKSHDA